METSTKNKLAVFELVPPKKQSNVTYTKRALSPESFYEEGTSQKKNKKRYKIENVELICECKSCNYATVDYCEYINHLGKHVDDRADDPKLHNDYSCNWRECDFVGNNMNYLKMHLSYHGYMAKLIALGKSLLLNSDLPECNEKKDLKIPPLPEYYVCKWDSCNEILWNYPVHIDHIKCHVNGQPSVAKGEEMIKCEWEDCSLTFSNKIKLKMHIKTHTKEKTIACPTCLVAFSCNTKFYDHRKRQLSVELQGYQCSQCSKSFASERLLRDHTRHHINHYKCHLCDMTCIKPSGLAKHIRYRHLKERPYKCDLCDHASITSYDLNVHKLKRHTADWKLECPYCEYTCRTRQSYNLHLKRHKNVVQYACHCCDKIFARGYYLTRHLMKIHNFHWPSGHSRFSYKQDPNTRLYHLQLVRYESLELTQEMMEENGSKQYVGVQDIQFKCEQIKNKHFALSIQKNSDINEQSNNISEELKSDNNVVISINDVDGKGNLIKTEIIETSKILNISDIKLENCKLIN